MPRSRPAVSVTPPALPLRPSTPHLAISNWLQPLEPATPPGFKFTPGPLSHASSSRGATPAQGIDTARDPSSVKSRLSSGALAPTQLHRHEATRNNAKLEAVASMVDRQTCSVDSVSHRKARSVCRGEKAISVGQLICDAA
ncbi:hypothetical protein CCHR01_01525 [Colletotrichum chrysophilum]|uniref:Uncharacterized protein n=1 Tax=Colletotrichum chrysophilum TaxID=1836956 RepID=A0AAD9AXU4_9PEZI|nr:hypothetical protein CCHR01_01525 [Colletotrichum chrysophilum]